MKSSFIKPTKTSVSSLSLVFSFPLLLIGTVSPVSANPIGSASDSLPQNKWSGWHEANKLPNVEYSVTEIVPPESCFLEDTPAAHFESCTVRDNIRHPIFIWQPDGTYHVNMLMDQNGSKERAYGKLNLNDGTFNRLKAGRAAYQGAHFFADWFAGNSSAGYELMGSLAINKTLPDDIENVCRFQPAQMLIQGLTYNINLQQSPPINSTINTTSSAIIGQGENYAFVSAFGIDKDGGIAAIYELLSINQDHDNPEKWVLAWSRMADRFGSEPYLLDQSRRHALLSDFASSKPAYYCDLDSPEDKSRAGFTDICKKLPSARNGSAQINYEGFDYETQKYLISYAHPNVANERCLYIEDMDVERIDPPSHCVVPLPEEASKSGYFGQAEIFNDGKILTFFSDIPGSSYDGLDSVAFYAAFYQEDLQKWSDLVVLNDAALALSSSGVVPDKANYHIDAVRFNHSNELEMVGTVTYEAEDSPKTVLKAIGVKFRAKAKEQVW